MTGCLGLEELVKLKSLLEVKFFFLNLRSK
jgi:hypothetical protein